MKGLRLMRKRVLGVAIMILTLAAGCGGGAAQGTPTPIPASVVRPVQPTPVYPARADVFTLATPAATPIFIAPTPAPPPAAALSAVESGPAGWQRAAGD
jgi:hypothetical protein